MLPAYLLSLREGIEAALIIGIVLGALRKMRRTDLVPAVWSGVAAAAVISLGSAVFLTIFGLELEGPSEPIFEGFTMLLAACVLTWMIFWMSRQSRHIKGELEAGVSRAAATTGRRALFGLAFVAVVREGIELALVAFCQHRASRPAALLPGHRIFADPVCSRIGGAQCT
jgi:high-affinity iron transporter